MSKKNQFVQGCTKPNNYRPNDWTVTEKKKKKRKQKKKKRRKRKKKSKSVLTTTKVTTQYLGPKTKKAKLDSITCI